MLFLADVHDSSLVVVLQRFTRRARGERPAFPIVSRLGERSGTVRSLLAHTQRLLQFPKFGFRGCWLTVELHYSYHLSTFSPKNLRASIFSHEKHHN